MAYSAGFTPHPKVSYANAAPTGTGSEAEYLEIALTEARDPEKLRDAARRVAARRARHRRRRRGPHLRARRPAHGLRVGAAARRRRARRTPSGRSTAFLAAETVEVQRRTKNGMRTFDARGRGRPRLGGVRTVRGLIGRRTRPCAILRLVVRHVTPAVRPDDVLSGLRAVADLAPPVPAAVTRLAQGLFDEETGTVTDPLAPDREAARPRHPRPPQLPPRRRRRRKVPRRTDVVAPPWYSGATWVGQRTDQKTFARPYAPWRTEPARQDTDSSRAAPAPRTAAPRIARAADVPARRTRRGAREPDGRNARMLEPTEPDRGLRAPTHAPATPCRRAAGAVPRPARRARPPPPSAARRRPPRRPYRPADRRRRRRRPPRSEAAAAAGRRRPPRPHRVAAPTRRARRAPPDAARRRAEAAETVGHGARPPQAAAAEPPEPPRRAAAEDAAPPAVPAAAPPAR